MEEYIIVNRLNYLHAMNAVIVKIATINVASAQKKDASNKYLKIIQYIYVIVAISTYIVTIIGTTKKCVN